MSSEKLMGVGREDFEERKEERIERLYDRAGKARAESNGAYKRSGEVVDRIPAGQPILVGHHSESRHRRDIERMRAAMDKSVAKDREAKDLAERASAAERNRSISGDDPDALAKLRTKLASMEAEREAIKALNRRCRKGEKAAIEEVMRRHPMWRSCGDDPSKGLPAYELTNLGANIRRVQQRIADLERKAVRQAREVEIGGWSVRENPETNRVEIEIGRRANEAEYRALKSYGFRWSKTNECWQRQATESAWHAAVQIAESFKGAA